MLNVGFFFFVLILFRGVWLVVGAWLVIAWLIHQALKPVSKNDPFLRRIYLRYINQSDRYEPYPYADTQCNRPTDFGRGVNG